MQGLNHLHSRSKRQNINSKVPSRLLRQRKRRPPKATGGSRKREEPAQDRLLPAEPRGRNPHKQRPAGGLLQGEVQEAAVDRKLQQVQQQAKGDSPAVRTHLLPGVHRQAAEAEEP